ncbi:hypothetical protein B0H16DRAFT_1728254 [Mycena metata]|uniref:Uncharacterized protein n=1 Tax=Mycena metata TaxID=1033252 RepID=A0AAD7IHZ7_9AGAR|nr:hypothetical protein B0H16DRAFT_1728254 [Mycena metata]
MEGMPLRRLYCHFRSLFATRDSLDFTYPFFMGLTHLEIFEVVSRDDQSLEPYKKLALLPNLTHLAFGDDGFSPIWFLLLQECAALRVLVVLDFIISGALLRVDSHAEDLVQDPRFLEVHSSMSCIADWIIGAHAGMDYWSRAEEFAAKRRSGEVDLRQYWVDRPVHTPPTEEGA